jgi:electron transport complex protein RnfG
MKKIITSTLILVAITLVAGLALAAVYEVTKEPIAEAEYRAKMEAYRAVMPDAADFTALELTDTDLPAGVAVDEVMTAVTADNATVGYVVKTTSANGYGGNITVAVGILPDGKILAVSVISQSETAGLGAKCTEDGFTAQFAGLFGTVEYTKTGEEGKVDALSGATVTTSAVTEAVNAALSYVNQHILVGEEG